MCQISMNFHSHLYQLSMYFTDAIALHGGIFSLKCGKVGSCIPQGDWYHNGELLQRNSTTLTVRQATFEDDGTYHCVNSGLNNSLLVAVYGKCMLCTHRYRYECHSLEHRPDCTNRSSCNCYFM